MNKEFIAMDLTHSLSPEIPHWEGECCFKLSTTVDYKDCVPPNLFRVQKFEAKAGSGTHIDAPSHCFPDSRTIDILEIEKLVTDCIVIHIKEAKENYKITPNVVTKFEQEYGKIEENTFVIFHTGWDKYWSEPKKYRNDLKFPSLHEDTAELLLKRNVAGIGIDTLSPDAGEDFPVHRIILGADKYIVENVANAENLSPTGAKILVLPMKIKDGTEAPVRLIALM